MASPNKKSKIQERKFNKDWLKKHNWLDFKNELMFCTICIKQRKKNIFTEGCNNFRTTTLDRHIQCTDHKHSVKEVVGSTTLEKMIHKQLNDNDNALVHAIRTMYFMTQNCIAMNKYGDFVDFLLLQGCKALEPLADQYKSHSITDDYIQSINMVINDSLKEYVQKAACVSLLTDESCDITNQKKLAVYMKTTADDCTVRTSFIRNVEVPDGTAATITDALIQLVDDFALPHQKVIGLGSDGASVMTGKKTGVGVRLKQNLNPHLVQIHCIAHRLALVTSQAASSVPYLKTYQEFLTSLYYWFKHSALRTHALSALQDVLDSDNIKIKEVHSVRWFSFYNSLEAVFRSWGALATLFEQNCADKNDPKSKGYLKTMGTSKFLIVTSILMDIIPVVTHLNVVFQKENLDLATVTPCVTGVVTQLKKLKDPEGVGKHEKEILESLGDKSKTHKDVRITDTKEMRSEAQTVKVKFIDSLVQKLDERFPNESTEIVSALSVLGLRGIRFVGKDNLVQFGEEKFATVLDFYKDLINVDTAKQEWILLKNLILDQNYSYINMTELWQIIAKFHKEEFPNLLVLAKIALALPVSTADVERGFSAQNLIKTEHRNRLTSGKVDALINIKLNGPPAPQFDFNAALKKFKAMKPRLFCIS